MKAYLSERTGRDRVGSEWGQTAARIEAWRILIHAHQLNGHDASACVPVGELRQRSKGLAFDEALAEALTAFTAE